MKDTTRLTIDMPTEEHTYLKMAASKLKISMKDFIIKATIKEIEECEDMWLAQEADQTWKRIDNGEEEIISWKDAQKELDI